VASTCCCMRHVSSGGMTYEEIALSADRSSTRRSSPRSPNCRCADAASAKRESNTAQRGEGCHQHNMIEDDVRAKELSIRKEQALAARKARTRAHCGGAGGSAAHSRASASRGQRTLDDGRSRKYSVTAAMFSSNGSPDGGPLATAGPAPSEIMMLQDGSRSHVSIVCGGRRRRRAPTIFAPPPPRRRSHHHSHPKEYFKIPFLCVCVCVCVRAHAWPQVAGSAHCTNQVACDV
jgi:hypothetical protein